MNNQPITSPLPEFLDPFNIAGNMQAVSQAWLNEPVKLQESLDEFFGQVQLVNTQILERFLGLEHQDEIPASQFDARFKDPIWQENPISDSIKEYYLLITHWVEDTIFNTPNIDDITRRRTAFWLRQLLNALAPTNFYWLNPKALERSITTGGKSIQTSIEQFITDWQNGSIPMVRPNAFKVGHDIAATQGEVIYQNYLFELIQYKPARTKVYQTPICIIPPWINKYYILDLSSKKSFVNYLVQQGFNVFILSWKNPDETMNSVRFEDYVYDGAYEAVKQVYQHCNNQPVHAVGYCIGGSALSMLMGWMANQPKHEKIINDWTMLCSLVDFSEPGDIDVFISEPSVKHIESIMSQTGFLEGRAMEHTFRMLRSNSLVWNYFVQQYLLGEQTEDFDILSWNTDTPRLPKAMHSYYLREFYLNNNLVKPNALTVRGKPVDLHKISAPLYAVGTEQDHITPWKSTFKIASIVNSTCRYVLATSGHIVGILSPPVSPAKRRYWVGEASGITDAEKWKNEQNKIQGSWWTDWTQWLIQQDGKKISAPKIKDSIRPAPGDYINDD